ncbi:META domain-containing protein [Vibrio sp. LaRot3]|uniref:META domain-containing protein n=1 Tax=Vibrio sp. LaRot3 TaxID=2998829 RepID=UPI0022CDC4B3|nr:META domain-containing protein [Vibrio sp. LaRot3]MDA0147820.1 META domain-containing protein [Vibrio sp. LaRot3]
MKLSSKTLVAALTLPVLLTACASQGDEVQQITASDLQHHHWELVSIDGDELALGDEAKAPTLEVGEKMTANGNAGCNNYFGLAELKDMNQFRIDKMGMTMKLCMGPANEIEHKFATTLSSWSEMTLTKENLVLAGEKHTLTFKLSDWKN